MTQYTPDEFDRLVSEMRPTTPAKGVTKRKADCTPEEWAGNLNARYEQTKSWHKKNKKLVRSRERARYAANPNPQKEKAQSWRAENKQRVLASGRLWRKKNPAYTRERLASDDSLRLAARLRTRLHAAVTRGTWKSGSAVRDLGCTIAELWLHLESKFQPGMTRDNMGTAWHLDHIYPMAKADLQDRSQFLAVNNWRNLQPLLPADNIAKNDKVLPEAQALFDQLCAEFA